MPINDKFDAPDADIILRTLGPPKRDFRVHKLVLSLASPVFKDMFSLPQPTSNDSRKSTVAEVEIVEVTDPAGALDIVLKMIYPFVPPPLDGDLDTLVECLVIAEKYNIEGAESRLYRALAQMSCYPPPSSVRYRGLIRVHQPHWFHLPPHLLVGSSPRDPRAPRRFRLRLRHRVPQIGQTIARPTSKQ
jgi:hypothetical protein